MTTTDDLVIRLAHLLLMSAAAQFGGKGEIRTSLRGKRMLTLDQDLPLAETTLSISRSSTTPGRKIPALQPNPFLTPVSLSSEHAPTLSHFRACQLKLEIFDTGVGDQIIDQSLGNEESGHLSSLPRDL